MLFQSMYSMTYQCRCCLYFRSFARSILAAFDAICTISVV
jgi:hypothetical protein